MELERVAGDSEHPPMIEYLALPSIFFAHEELARRFHADWVDDVDVPHIIETIRTAEAELCRKLLMATCQIDGGGLRSLLKGQDASSLALYRGFSRFMLEDLALNQNCAALSQSQRKKLATKVAFEMMMVRSSSVPPRTPFLRTVKLTLLCLSAKSSIFQSRRAIVSMPYSTLHPRVSPSIPPCLFSLFLIKASDDLKTIFKTHGDADYYSSYSHRNCGPKFGIRMFPSNAVRAIESFSTRQEPKTQDLLHTPTPWHNCIVEVEGDKMLYLTKLRAVSDAVQSQAFDARWVVDEKAVVDGHFFLQRKRLSDNSCGATEVADEAHLTVTSALPVRIRPAPEFMRRTSSNLLLSV